MRRARLGDADAVAAIEAAWPSAAGWTRKQVHEELAQPDSIFVVAEKAGKIAAYVLARAEAGDLRIYAVGVLPELARLGHARAVLAFALERAREARLHKASLEVSSGNTRAERFYEAAGFKIVGRRPKFYNDGSDALLMDLPL